MRTTIIAAALLLAATAAQAEVIAVSESSYPGIIGLTDSPCLKGTGRIAVFDSRITKNSAMGCWVEVGEKVVISWNIESKKTVYEYPVDAFIIK